MFFVPDTTRDPSENTWAVWFRRVLWLGIIQDLVLGVPAIFWPNELLVLLKQTPALEPVYVSFAAFVLVVLGLMYVPAAINPYKYPMVAWLAVLARPPGILFFFVLYPGTYSIFGWVDTILSLLQLPLLLMTFYATPKSRQTKFVKDDPKAQSSLEYRGTTFQHLRDVLWSDRYPGKLPYHLGLGPLKLVTFFNHAARNLADKRDLLPYFDKLIHSNGICHTGVWEITEESPYTGYFSKGSKGLVIARASVAGLQLTANTRRAIGIGGKIFPTMDPNQTAHPANFVVVSRLSGVRTKHIVDIEMTNSPTRGLSPIANFVSRVVFRLMDTRPGYRQLHPISTLGMGPGDVVETPDLMMLKIADGTPRIEEKDFREELRVGHYPNQQLVYSIFVRNFDESAWNRIGSLTFTEDATSESGDKRLHFWIPRDTQTTHR